jgi:hypothetical protein
LQAPLVSFFDAELRHVGHKRQAVTASRNGKLYNGKPINGETSSQSVRVFSGCWQAATPRLLV